jgi:YggT family protein
VFVLGNVLIGLATVLGGILWVYMWILIGRAIISWVNADPRNAIVRFLIMATDPPLRVIRRMLPASLRYFPLDIAFLVLFGLVVFAQYAVVQSLHDLGERLRQPELYSPPPAASGGALSNS